MKRNIIILACAIMSLVFQFCMPVPVQRLADGGPAIRVGVLQHVDGLRIKINGAFQITDETGKKLGSDVTGGEWDVQIKHGKTSRSVYRLLVLSTADAKNAETKRAELDANRFPADVITVGRKITETTHLPSSRRQAWFDTEHEYKTPGKDITDNRVYHVYLNKTFAQLSEAEAYSQQIATSLPTTIQETHDNSSSGTITLQSQSGVANFSFDETIKIIGSMVTILSVSPETAEKWEAGETRTYRGDMELRIDSQGKLTVINELPVESYLRGVVPAEMSASFPPEALKAQAVAARSNVIPGMGIRHADDHFDVCDEEHCQVYRGTARETDLTDKAVAETQGAVMMYAGKICNATYSSTCGGHTEANESVWSGSAVPYLRGVLDSDMRKDLLSGRFNDEAFVRQWITSDRNVKVYCNALGDNVPFSLKYYAKYFRWEVRYQQDELAELVRKKTGSDLGKIKNIALLARGVSGRLTKIRIEGTQGELVVEKDLQIRNALGDPKLNSSCFIVERVDVSEEIPTQFVIRGAGSGHGVGLCQVGAAGMALTGKKYDAILKHYFQDVTLKKIY